MANETVNMYLQLKPIYTKQLNEMTKSLHQMLDNMNANPSFIKQEHLTVAKLEVKAIQQMQIPKPLNSTTFRVRFKPSLVATDDTISLEFSMTPDLEGLLNDMPAQGINVINILHINLEKMSYIQLKNIRKLLQSYKHNMTYWAAKPTNLFVELDKEMYWFCLDTNEQKKTKEKITAYWVNDEAKQLLNTETTFNETMNQIRMEYKNSDNNMSSHMTPVTPEKTTLSARFETPGNSLTPKNHSTPVSTSNKAQQTAIVAQNEEQTLLFDLYEKLPQPGTATTLTHNIKKTIVSASDDNSSLDIKTTDNHSFSDY